jgi:hypothetical protein
MLDDGLMTSIFIVMSSFALRVRREKVVKRLKCMQYLRLKTAGVGESRIGILNQFIRSCALNVVSKSLPLLLRR